MHPLGNVSVVMMAQSGLFQRRWAKGGCQLVQAIRDSLIWQDLANHPG